MSEVVTTVLDAVDNTRAAFQSAARNHALLVKSSEGAEQAIARAAKRMGESVEQYRRRIEATKAAMDDYRRAAQNASDSTDKSGQSARRGGSELAALASRYLTVAAAIETARRSFVSFGDEDFKMRRLQVQSGETADRIHRLLPGLKQLEKQLKVPIDNLIDGFSVLRQRAHLSVDQTEAIFPKIAMAARGMNVETKDLASVFASLMTNLSVKGSDAERVMDMLARSIHKFDLDADELVSSLPELTTAMHEWGSTGVEGVQRMLSHVASLRPAFRNTSEAAAALTRILIHPDNERIANRLQMSTRAMMDYLRKYGAEGGDVIKAYLSMVDLAMKNGLRMEELDIRQRRVIIAMRAGLIDQKKAYEDIGRAAGDARAATSVMATGAAADWIDLKNNVHELFVELGGLLQQINKTFGTEQHSLIEQFTTKVRALSRLLHGEFSLDVWKDLTRVEGRLPKFLLPGPTPRSPGDQSQRYRPMPGVPEPSGAMPPATVPSLGANPPPFPGPSGAFQRMSLEAGREQRHQTGQLHNIEDLLRQIRDRQLEGADSTGGDSGGEGSAPSGGGVGRGSHSLGRSPDSGRSGGGGGGEGGGQGDFVSNAPMSDEERNMLGLIVQHESKGRNVPNYKFGPGFTAQGYFQITNTNWRKWAPKLNIKARSAMEASYADQERVALAMKRSRGNWNDWIPFNPSLRQAVRRGDRPLPRYAIRKPQEFVGGIPMPRSRPAEGTGALGAEATGGAGASPISEQARIEQNYAELQRMLELRGDPFYKGQTAVEWRKWFGYREGENAPAPSVWEGGRLPAPGDIEDIIGRGGAKASGPSYKSDEELLEDEELGRQMRKGSPQRPFGGTKVNDVRALRQELERPIVIRAQLESQERQFRRSSINREVSREMREARWDSYSDIGAA